MSDVRMLLDGLPLTIAEDGTIRGQHEMVEMCNLKVRRTIYSPDLQQTAISLLQRLGAVLVHTEAVRSLFAYPADFDPFVWY